MDFAQDLALVVRLDLTTQDSVPDSDPAWQMKKPSEKRVTYERPPIVEVSFGTHFAPLVGFRVAEFGMFWSQLGSEFNESLDKPLLGDATALAQEEWFPPPRVWFVHRNTEHLIQLQPNRFYFNWRLSREKAPYPRFQVLKPLFETHLNGFGKFVAERGLGEIKAEGFELTYVNHLLQGDGWEAVDDVGNVFPDLTWRKHRRPQGNANAFAWSAVFDCPVGKLNASIKQGSLKAEPNRNLFIFELRLTKTAGDLAIADISHWLDEANDTLVAAFRDLTSESIQTETWKRVSG